MTLSNDDGPARRPLGRGVTLAMAACCGIAVANIYYNQPLLGIMEHDFPGQKAIVGLVPTATQLGYAAGIIFLVPLGDVIERRRLILSQVAVLVAALVLAALAPAPWAMVVTFALVGIAATLAQQIIPYAADLAAPDRRGAVIGTVMSGLLCGILLARTLAGYVGHLFGWRAVFVVAIGLAVGMGALLVAVLPGGERKPSVGYGALMRSLLDLLLTQPTLRRATAIQTALFASFSVFWTILALHLESPPFGLGADIAGLFGLVGGIGVLIAPVAGRLADRRGPQVAIGWGVGVVLVSWLVFGLWTSVAGLIVGVLLLDVGVQAALISNQHVIYSLAPDKRSRLNTIFVAGLFLGGALGSAGATLCWHHGGWPLVSLFGGALTCLAMALHLTRART